MQQEWHNQGTDIVPLQLRASQIHRICTNKPYFDPVEYAHTEQDFIATLEKKKLIYEPDQIDLYCETDGIKTKAQKLRGLMEKRILAEEDPLPQGAKTYLQELWLEANCNFYDLSLNPDDPKLLKGNMVEDDAIELVGNLYQLNIKKNDNRIVKGNITGECDVTYNTVVRDAKCPENWASFRKKTGIEIAYFWQLVTYCYLYDCNEAYLDYILMKTPRELIDIMCIGKDATYKEKLIASNDAIDNLTLDQRVKTYQAENIQSSIEFLLSRASKAEEYYNNLTYEECMNMN